MPISQAVMDEIKRKALAGEKMATPTAEKTKIFNSFLSQNNPASAVTRTTATNRTTTNNSAANPANSAVNTTMRNTAVNTTPQQDPNAIDTQAIYRQVLERLNQPQAQFSYNPNTDPQYQAALQQAQQNATLGNNANMAEMNRRGILNSTITSDRGAEIQQNALGRVTSEVLPQLMAQSYQRFIDQQNAGQEQARNLLGLAGTIDGRNQQDWQNRFNFGQAIGTFGNGQQTLEKAQQDWLNRFNFGQATGTFGNGQQTLENKQFQYTQGRDKVADQQWEAEFERIKQQDGIANALNWAQNSIAQQNANTSSANSARASSQDNLANLYRIWENTGKAPAGIPGVQAGTPLFDQVGARNDNAPAEVSTTQAKNNAFAEYTATLDTMEPDEIRTALEQEKANIIKELGPSGYTTLVNMYFDKNGNPK